MPTSSHRSVALALTVLLTIAAYFGLGLHPRWAATWLVPWLGFMAAARLTGWKRVLPGTLALFVGSLSEWSYLSFLPVVVRVVVLLIPALAFGGCTALFGSLASRRCVWLALGLPPAFFVSYEYAYSLISPHSTFGAIAYTQADCLPILQLASLGGVWLIGGLIFFVGAGAALLSGASDRLVRGRLVLATLLPLVAALGYGEWRLHVPPAAASLRVGLLASDRPENRWYRGSPNSEVVLQHYVAQLPALARGGAELVLLPEHLIGDYETGPDANVCRIDRVLQDAAQAHHVRIVLGVDRFDAHGAAWNEARTYSPEGAIVRYDKHHLLPGPESIFTPGVSYTVLTDVGRRLGLAICKDLDFPATGREYAHRNTGVLIVPAYDFSVDGWLHARMAVERAVEAGCSLVRCAKFGRLTVSDSRGRILAEAASAGAEFAQLVAAVPTEAVPTLYARFGDWFAWICLGTLVLGLLSALAAKRSAA